jgi:hypothetical protein
MKRFGFDVLRRFAGQVLITSLGERIVDFEAVACGLNGRGKGLEFTTQRKCGPTKINKWKALPANSPLKSWKILCR